MRALTIGSIVCDISITIDQTIKIESEGTKIPINNLTMTAGGGGVNSALIISKLQQQCSVVGILGKDGFAHTIQKELAEYKISQDFIQISDTTKTALSFLLPTKENQTIILTYKGAGLTLSKEHLAHPLSLPWDIVYIAPISGPLNQALEEIITTIKKQNPHAIVAHNPSPYQLQNTPTEQTKILPLVDLYILNREEAHLSWQQTHPELPFSISTYLTHCAEDAPHTIFIVTQGNSGLTWQQGKLGEYCAAQTIQQRHSVGAGDACGAAIATALAYGYTTKDGINLGMRIAETVLTNSTLADAKILPL